MTDTSYNSANHFLSSDLTLSKSTSTVRSGYAGVTESDARWLTPRLLLWHYIFDTTRTPRRGEKKKWLEITPKLSLRQPEAAVTGSVRGICQARFGAPPPMHGGCKILRAGHKPPLYFWNPVPNLFLLPHKR